ncbi:uncharacterized protein LOC125555954 [Triticum urartu]|uniref:uncharacterized protein LOC125555954 n=1 Tax=Triticum urartu TaxID=4572 RepID=UPI0020441B53|nr:uncharacterized protein LOC125555954 [Triticum urartu]
MSLDNMGSYLRVLCSLMHICFFKKVSGDIEDSQDGQHAGIDFAELARTDDDLVTYVVEGTVYLWSPVDLMTLAAAATGEQTHISIKLARVYICFFKKVSGDIEDSQDGQRVGIDFAELARTDDDLVTYAVEGTIYLRSPVDLMTLAAATTGAVPPFKQS